MSEQSEEDPAERSRVEEMRATYKSTPEPEQQRMINLLRFKLLTIPHGERMALIDDIECQINKGFHVPGSST